MSEEWNAKIEANNWNTKAYSGFCSSFNRILDFYTMYKDILKIVDEILQKNLQDFNSIVNSMLKQLIKPIKKKDELKSINSLMIGLESNKLRLSDSDFNRLKSKIIELHQNPENINDKFQSIINEMMQSTFKEEFKKQLNKIPTENLLELEKLLPNKPINDMSASDFGQYAMDTIHKFIKEPVSQKIQKKEPIVTELLRELSLISLHSAVEVYLQDLILELYNHGIKDEDINVGVRVCPHCRKPLRTTSLRAVKENSWRFNREILESGGFSFYHTKEFEKINQLRIDILHRGDKITISLAELEEKFSFVKKLVQTFETQVKK